MCRVQKKQMPEKLKNLYTAFKFTQREKLETNFRAAPIKEEDSPFSNEFEIAKFNQKRQAKN